MSDSYVSKDGKFDTQNLIMDSFLKNLGGASKQNIERAPKPLTQKIATTVLSAAPNYNTEKLLMDLYETRDNLVSTFNEIGFTLTSQSLVESINKIGSCITDLGGEIDTFDPLANMSGLQSPKLTKNAERVIENTREAYALNKIDNADVAKDGKTITIAFAGKKNDIYWKAVGTLEANETWMGNEAIDYVYTPKSGRMAVKMPTAQGQWVDKSNDYKISWELFESPDDMNKEAGKIENNKEIKEEVIKDTPNDIDKDINDDFEIREQQ